MSWSSTHAPIEVPEEQRTLESTGEVPTKDPSKVKSVIEESPITQKSVRVRKFHVPWRRGDLVLIEWCRADQDCHDPNPWNMDLDAWLTYWTYITQWT